MPFGRASSVATTRTLPSWVDETDCARLLGRDRLVEVDVRAAIGGDDEIVGAHGNVPEVEGGDDIPVLVDVVDLRLEKGGDHQCSVGQPAQSRRVWYLGLDDEVTRLAGRVHLACRTVAEPQSSVVPPRSFAVNEPVDKRHRFDSCGHQRESSARRPPTSRVRTIPGWRSHRPWRLRPDGRWPGP